MDGQPPNYKGARRLSGSDTLSTLEGLVEAYAASEHSVESHAFIHAGDLDRQSYIDARLDLEARPPPLIAVATTPGPAPSRLPPAPTLRPAPFRGELDESDEAVPTPPTRILDRVPPPSVSQYLSDLGSAVFDAQESVRDSVSAMGQNQDEIAAVGEVSVFQPYETTFGKYKLFPRTDLAPRIDTSPSKSNVSYPSNRILTPYKSYTQLGKPQALENSTSPQLPSSIHTQHSTPSLARTIPIDTSGYYDDDQNLILQRQSKPSFRVLETGRTHSLANDTTWLQRDKEGKRRSWSLFAVCAIIPFILLLFAFGGFDKVMVQMAGTHARPTLYQKSLAKYLCVAEILFYPSLAA